jgi:hypothetical protein
MPASGRNTHRISEFEGGYLLNSGKRLTREIAEEIGRGAGLNMNFVPHEDRNAKKVDLDSGIGFAETNPFYSAYIDENPPKPPMLQFFSSCVNTDVETFGAMRSRYTINLNTLKPTGPSPIQTQLSEAVLAKLKG